jgi:hypothetical protein
MRRLRVFLSYARENVKQVEELYQELVDAGIQPWMDTIDLLPGQDWELAIKTAIEQTDFFVVCLSAQSVSKRGYLQREIKRAQELWDEKLEDDIYLIPARLDSCEVPASLSRFQWVNLYEDYGFSRLLKAIQAGTEKTRSVLRIDELQEGEDTDLTASGKHSQPKYFYYVSREKVEMLLPQMRVGGMHEESHEPLIKKAIRLLGALDRSNSVLSLDETTKIGASKFYASRTVWHNGLFYFRTMVSVTVAYFLWRKHGDSIIVLTGSPDNIIGSRVASQGVRLSSTADAIDTIGSSEILDVINSNEVSSVVVGGTGRTSRGIPRAQKPVSVAGSDREVVEGWFKETAYTQSREVGLAIFCLSHLSNLPEMTIDTVFRIYSTYSSKGANLFEDLEAEHKQGQQEYAILYTDDRLKEAQRMGMANFRTIYIGSPLYTAIG